MSSSSSSSSFSSTKTPLGELEQLLPDWPQGPLTEYRRRASFDWRQMRVLLDGEDVAKFKAKVWAILERDPLFNRPPWEEMSRDEYRKLTFLRIRRLIEFDFLNEDDFIMNPNLAPAVSQCIGQIDWSMGMKKFMSHEYFIASTRGAGSSSQIESLNMIKNFDALGCFSLTELGHGSNTKAMQTTATFDPASQEFIMHTPDIQSIKCWSGGMGQTATHAVVFAQLCTPDGQQHGLHSFLTPIRDPHTLLPYAGVKIGDMGPKIGLNGVDNGFLIFDNYRIPRGTLMNRNADITPDGKYVSKVGDKKKRMGASFGILSAGRVGIIGMSLLNMEKALVIAVRYAHVRRQFGPDHGVEQAPGGGHNPPAANEWPIIEYQSHQWRLLPYLAAAYVHHHFYRSLFQDYIDFFIRVTYNGASPLELADMGAEIHALTCSGKAYVGWLARDCIQECREACGGHGYLKAAGIGYLRDDHDSNNTYEGDNNVIVQQTSNSLIKFYNQHVRRKGTDDASTAAVVSVSSPYESMNFVPRINETLANYRMPSGGPQTLEQIVEAFRFLVSYLLKQTSDRLDEQLELNNRSLFVAKTRSQVYYAKILSLVYYEFVVLERLLKAFPSPDCQPTNATGESGGGRGELARIMGQLGLLYGLHSLEKWSPYLFEANAIKSGSSTLKDIREHILKLCAQLKDNSLALADALAPPDWVLRSSLGKSDGRLYENLYEAITKSKGCFERPEWFEEFTVRKVKLGSLKPKF
uniref:Acyl-coenzyme A oxidase n=1 Tax=Aceria tosichella TaxID=561515 RepID=A0A6G1SML4_9ACAR